MEREIVLGNKPVSYLLKESSRAKRVNITLHRDGTVIVSLPKGKSEREAEDFIREKTGWILKHLKDYKKDNGVYLPDHTGGTLELLKEYAHIFVSRKITTFNEHYRLPVRKVVVKNQKSQWGSCTEKGILNFSYKLVLLPAKLAEYVIVHELCHLKEFNHSNQFWSLVGETIKKPKELDKELGRYHLR